VVGKPATPAFRPVALPTSSSFHSRRPAPG
jgi:hypothetical protein